ncbi:hypothetical protein K469DRAFT_810221 [Zopfia rhizophila CBS 207.26]|uniref:Uncharacterized protein n=1 Tax=Zopfia rhizophila CBS 207.26 TaxID=1314779 RepID=A0A6A6DF93_9PEZI|nr:hypothetical protein K469DRAFT_810221 [Zopfia rhizophila CBS 207.26]
MVWPFFIARTRSNRHVIAHGRKKKLRVSQGKRKNRKSSVRRRRKLRRNGFLKNVRLLELLNERRELLRKSRSILRKKKRNSRARPTKISKMSPNRRKIIGRRLLRLL